MIFLSFLGGLLTECLAVLWVHYSEKNKKVHICVVSGLLGVCNVLGIGGALSGGWHCSVAYVLGFALGPLVGIQIKQRLERSDGS